MQAAQVARHEAGSAARARHAGALLLRFALVALPLVAASWLLLSGRGAQAVGPGDPHGASSSCAACHRVHTGHATEFLTASGAQHTLCLTCHNGTGADSNVQAELSGLPANDAATGAYYQHPVLDASSLTHTSATEDEFGGVRNRHSECTDCHNPHTLPGHGPSMTPTGWTPSGLISESAGVALPVPPGTWLAPVTLEYQLCLKCHSAWTLPRDDSTVSDRNKTFDKAAELAATTGSFHPVAAPGTNQTAVLQANLQAGRLWRFSTGDTIRCTSCHGNRLLVNYSSSLALESPARNAVLAPHGSTNRSIPIAPYADTPGSPLAYQEGNYALCFLCHDPGVFSGSSPNTNFPLHKQHVVDQGAVCAECHYRLHSTKSAYYPANALYARLINFAPNVTNGGLAPVWSLANQSCTLTCHGKDHAGALYAADASGTSTPGALPDGAGGGASAKLPSEPTPASATMTPTPQPPTPTPTPKPTLTPTPTPHKPRPGGGSTVTPLSTPTGTPTPTPVMARK